MPESQEGPQFLKEKYNLHNFPEVRQAAKRTRSKTGEKVPNNPNSQIQNYLNRLENVFNPLSLESHPDFDRKGRNLDMLKPAILDKFVTKFEDIPDSFWKGQERIVRERGQSGDYSRFSEEEKNKWKKELTEGLLDDQSSSLEQWIDYFASDDSKDIPGYVKYWVFRSVLDLAEYDKEKQEFPKRSKGTVKMFPDINQEALGYVADALLAKHKGMPLSFGDFEFDLTEEQKLAFRKGLESENFARLYAWANEQIKPIPEHLLPVTSGRWIKYDQNSGHRQLVQSIRGRGTGWCTAGENTAIAQLKGGDFHIFYSNDDEGKATMPRIAIRMEGERIAEVRGIAVKQNLDPYIGGVLEEKLDEFPDKHQYLKQDHDMRVLTEIDNKAKQGEALGREDLVFLYELDSKIQGFGYQDDPRIEELRSTRNPVADMPIVFECEPMQIAQKPSEINEHTKAYVGKLEQGIFDKIRRFKIEHVYTRFPEVKIRLQDITIGGKTKQELERELIAEKINISDYARDLLKSRDFTTLSNQQTVNLVRLKISDLGLSGYPTTDQVYAKANELGLDLCPAEVGPHLRLTDKNQPLNEWYYVGMKQITDSDGSPDVFLLVRFAVGLWLDDSWAGPDSSWVPGSEFVFSLRK